MPEWILRAATVARGRTRRLLAKCACDPRLEMEVTSLRFFTGCVLPTGEVLRRAIGGRAYFHHPHGAERNAPFFKDSFVLDRDLLPHAPDAELEAELRLRTTSVPGVVPPAFLPLFPRDVLGLVEAYSQPEPLFTLRSLK